MFPENSTDRVRKVMSLTNQCAQGVNHDEINSEHLLIGLLKENQGVGVTTLKNLGVNLRTLWLDVEVQLTPGPSVVAMGKLPLSDSAKLVIELGKKAARDKVQSYFGTEHLLIGLIQDRGIAGQTLIRFGVTLETIRVEIARLLAEEATKQPPTEAASSDTAGITARLKMTSRDGLVIEFLEQVELAKKGGPNCLTHANLAIAFAAMANNFPNDSK